MFSLQVRTIYLSTGIAALFCIGVTGCDTASSRAGMTSGYPLDRVRAAVACAEAGDAEAVDRLIELLNDNDRGVRMYSILALRQLCGEDYGFRYYASDSERAAAVARWRVARLRGEVTLKAKRSEPPAAPEDSDDSSTLSAVSKPGGNATP